MLSLVVVGDDGPRLFDRDWLGHVTLDWKTIGLIKLDSGLMQVEALKEKYKDVFFSRDKGYKAHITVNSGACPKFYLLTSVPFALKPAIVTELDRLEAAGVIRKVNQSDWAVPIVGVHYAESESMVTIRSQLTSTVK